MTKFSIGDLRQMQAMPLNAKIDFTITRIKAWYDAWKRYFIVDEETGKTRYLTTTEENVPLKESEYISEVMDGAVYVAFSGGKDSTVLAHIARQIYPDIELVFVNTGLEYPEIQKFVKTFDNVTILRPSMRFDEVIKKYGYPFISKEVGECIHDAKTALRNSKITQRVKQMRGEWTDNQGNKSRYNYEKYEPLLDVDFNISNKCCAVTKKKPSHDYAKQSGKMQITAQIAEESRLRTQKWLQNGCNAFDLKTPISNPMSFWTEQDILQYIKQNDIEIASVYGDILYRGNDGLLYENSICGGNLCTTGCDRTGCIFCGFGAHLDKGESRFERLKRTHPRQYEYCMSGGEYDSADGLWKPNKDGLGMAHCIDVLNKIYGNGFIKY